MIRNLLTILCLVITTCLSGQSKALRIEKSGKGDPVLFLPGFVTPGSVWNQTISHLAKPVNAIRVTYAGFDGVPAIDTPWYPVLKSALIEYISKEKLTKLTIIGHSMGGTLALDLAAALPEKIDKIILVDALPCMLAVMMPGLKASDLYYNSPYNNQALKMNDSAFAKTAAMMSKNMASGKPDQDSIVDWVLGTDRKTYVYGYTDLLKVDLRDSLGSIKAKALILGASYPTEEVVTKTFNEQYAKLQNKSLMIASGSRHFVMLDKPEWFYKQVNMFLAK